MKMFDFAAEAILMGMGVRNMMNVVLIESAQEEIATGQADIGPLSPGSESMGAHDDMLGRYHGSLIENDHVEPMIMSPDGLFASSVQNLYDANGQFRNNDHCGNQ